MRVSPQNTPLGQQGWRVGYHWTQWYSIYSILLNGFKNSTGENTKKGKEGVYTHETMERGATYRVFTHMPDGVAWCVCCELLIDDSRSSRPGNQQTATPQEHTWHLLARLLDAGRPPCGDVAVGSELAGVTVVGGPVGT